MEKTHEKCKEMILNDEIADSYPESALLKQHLETCPECRQLRRDLDKSLRLIRNAPEIQPRSGFTSRWRVLQAERIKRQKKIRTWAFIGAGVSILFGVLIILAALVFTGNLTSGIVGISELAIKTSAVLLQMRTAAGVYRLPLQIIFGAVLALMGLYFLIILISAITISFAKNETN